MLRFPFALLETIPQLQIYISSSASATGTGTNSTHNHDGQRYCMQTPIMASIFRPALLRQTALAASTRQAARVSTSFAQQSVRSAILKDSARCAAFHTSSRRSLLPPGPRMLRQCHPSTVAELTFTSQRSSREAVRIHSSTPPTRRIARRQQENGATMVHEMCEGGPRLTQYDL